MKTKILLLIIILITMSVINGKQPEPSIREDLTTLILVRHAEKVLDNSEDPVLTAAGKKRAGELAYILAHAPIDFIYSTPYKRTKATIAPVAKSQHLTIKTYPPLQELDFLKKLLKSHKGKTILVCGHSNTIPAMVSILTGNKKVIAIKDHVYDNLFMLQVRTIGDTILIRLRFGANTPEGPR